MNVAQRLYLIASLMIFGGGAFWAYVAASASDWDRHPEIRQVSAYNEELRARIANDQMALTRARESQRIASMSADERFQGQRYFAYGLMGVGALFGLVGFVVSGERGGAQASATNSP